MKKYIKSAETPRRSPVDLSEEYNIGLEAIAELRKMYPQIPAKPKFRRGHQWSDVWFITFYLDIDVQSAAREYVETGVDSLDVADYIEHSTMSTEWDYEKAFDRRCNQLFGNRFYNDFVQCHVNYRDFSHDGDYRGLRQARPGYESAILTVYALTKKR